MHARNRGLEDVLATSEHGRVRAKAMRAQVCPLVSEILRRAHEQGTLHEDFAPEDAAFVLWTGDWDIERGASFTSELWQRFLGLLLDGLRAGRATAPPAPQVELARVARLEEG
jgi:hypothetical protein